MCVCVCVCVLVQIVNNKQVSICFIKNHVSCICNNNNNNNNNISHITHFISYV